MDMFVSSAAFAAAPAAMPASPDASAALIAAAASLLDHLALGRAVDTPALRAAMSDAFGGSDAEGAWDWKTGYDACEAATVLFLRKFGPGMRGRAGSPAALLAMLAKVAALLPSHTRRSEESQALQQFSTPIALGFAAATAAAITPADLVLEPSAGTGLLAIFAELAGGRLVLNELAETRAALLGRLFPGVPVTRHDAAQIHDHLDLAVRPSVVLMNPPFSVAAHVEGRVADAAFRHVTSALARLAEGGRLVAITGASLSPDNPAWRDAFVHLQERGRVVFSAAIDGRVYARHGTTVDTRLTVIDRVPADDPTAFPASPGMAADAATLLGMGDGAGSAAAAGRRRDALRATTARPLAGSHAIRLSAPRRISVPAQHDRTRPASNSPTRPSTGSRPRAAASPRRCMKDTALQSIRIAGSQAASDPAGAVGGDGLGRAAQALLPAASAGSASSPMAFCPTPNSRASSMPARPMPAISPDRGSSTRPSMSSRPRPTTPSTRCASGAAGCWATAPAPARAARSPASSSTIG